MLLEETATETEADKWVKVDLSRTGYSVLLKPPKEVLFNRRSYNLVLIRNNIVKRIIYVLEVYKNSNTYLVYYMALKGKWPFREEEDLANTLWFEGQNHVTSMQIEASSLEELFEKMETNPVKIKIA